MAQIFHPSMNTIARASIFGAAFVLAAAAWVGARIYSSPYVTQQYEPRQQPVPFSHEHHVKGLGIDCRYCHTSVEESHFAGLPPTQTCMTCHSQIWTNAQMLAPVRESFATKTPIKWNRVHALPDYVFFNHSVHVAKGVGCSTCHGEVNEMPLMWQNGSLYMQWCLKCHNHPEQFLRPREEIFTMPYVAKKDQLELGKELVEKYHVNTKQLDNCAVCHR